MGRPGGSANRDSPRILVKPRILRLPVFGGGQRKQWNNPLKPVCAHAQNGTTRQPGIAPERRTRPMTVAFMRRLPRTRQERVADIWHQLRRDPTGGYSSEMIAEAILNR